MTKPFPKIAVYLILIVLLAGAIRMTRAFEEKRYSVDAYLYFEMAESWAYYGADYAYLYIDNSIPPLLPWIMAIGYNVGISPEHTGIIIGVFLGSLVPLSVFWIALNLFSTALPQNKDVLSDAKTSENVLPINYVYALLAAFLVAVHPFWIRISVSCLREILYLPFMAFAVAFAISAIYNKSLSKWCVFAIFTALANMARREGIILLIIFFAWQVLEFSVDWKNFRKNIKYYILISSFVSIIFLGLTIPILYIMLRYTSSVWTPFGIFKVI